MDLSELNDVQAESGVIATLVYHPEFILHTDYLKPGYFYATDNGCIYWAISELYKAGVENIDALNISNMLTSNNRYENKERSSKQFRITIFRLYKNISIFAPKLRVARWKSTSSWRRG